MLLATIISTVLYACQCLCIAELSAALPFSGGPSIFAHAAFGNVVSFLLAYCYLGAYLIAASYYLLSAVSLFQICWPTLNTRLLTALLLLLSLSLHGNRKVFFSTPLSFWAISLRSLLWSSAC
jgi:amino acid transporter